jgi:hypothetical protein
MIVPDVEVLIQHSKLIKIDYSWPIPDTTLPRPAAAIVPHPLMIPGPPP